MSGNNIALENIVYPTKKGMAKGTYVFKVHNYSCSTCQKGFTAEIEVNGELHQYAVNTQIRGNQTIEVARMDVDTHGNVTITDTLTSQFSSKEVWGIQTQQFHKVNMIVTSPNHWEGSAVGNKHLFFVLDNCKNPDPTRGFYNEFLKAELEQHRKVLEILGSQTKVESADEQLAGLGFSSTINNNLIVRVSGNFTRKLNITF